MTEDGTLRTVYTHVVTADDIDESIRLTAHLLQAWIPRQYEVRLTVVDDVFFATRIDATSVAATVDWRADYDALIYRPLSDVPAPVRVGVLALMARLDLRFGALDFVVTPDNEWIFLEINSNGRVGVHRRRHRTTHRLSHCRRTDAGDAMMPPTPSAGPWSNR